MMVKHFLMPAWLSNQLTNYSKVETHLQKYIDKFHQLNFDPVTQLTSLSVLSYQATHYHPLTLGQIEKVIKNKKITLTTEPHDEHHFFSNFMFTKFVAKQCKRKYVSRSAKQTQHYAPHNKCRFHTMSKTARKQRNTYLKM